MNPFKHLDMTGSFVVPMILVVLRSPFIFGWAKPVPFNPYNLKNQKWGPGIVGIAGPLSNFFIAGAFGLLAYLLPVDPQSKTDIAYLAISNGVAPAGSYTFSLFYFSAIVVWINVFLGIFNLIPIPPLDGSKVLFSFVPYKWSNIQTFLEKYGFFIFIFFILFFSGFLTPIVLFLFRLFLGV